MASEAKIKVETFKIVTRAIAESDNLEIMASHLTNLLVAALEIKGSAIFALNPETRELEILASFGLSPKYLSKGPVLAEKSIAANLQGEPVVISDVSDDDRVQYPDHARAEGIGSIASVPILFSGEVIGALRLYRKELWDMPDEDLDSLNLLAENIGLAMTCTRLLNAMCSVSWIIQDALPSPLQEMCRKGIRF